MRIVAALFSPVALAAPMQDVLQPAGPQAGHIHALWLLMLAVCSIVLIAVTVAMLLAVRRASRGDESTPGDAALLTRDEHRIHRVVGTAVGASIAGLLLVFGATVITDRALAQLPLNDGVHIRLVGHQWWWEATYDDPQPANVFSTANELHVPVGRPVVLTLEADDVIHSFWVPNLHGKKDLIPGRTATFAFRADVPGTYRGQCAEYCGYQHANMALLVIAEPPERYELWAAAERTSAPQPTEPLARVKDRKFVDVNPDNFDAVLESMKPHLAFAVENKLSEDPEAAKLKVDLNFKSMDDFSPDAVARQVKPLRELLELRDRLSDLRGSMQGNDKLEELLREAVTDKDKLARLRGELGKEGSNE